MPARLAGNHPSGLSAQKRNLDQKRIPEIKRSVNGEETLVVPGGSSYFFRVAEPRILDAGIVNVSFGERVKIVRPVNLYCCTLGDDCFVGPFVEIQNDVVIGPRTRVQSHAFICELVTVGADCFISHGAMFINDRISTGKPAIGRRETWGRTLLGDRVVVGTNATILPVSICADVVIGAGSVVTSDIVKPGVYAGNPARYRRALP